MLLKENFYAGTYLFSATSSKTKRKQNMLNKLRYQNTLSNDLPKQWPCFARGEYFSLTHPHVSSVTGNIHVNKRSCLDIKTQVLFHLYLINYSFLTLARHLFALILR